MSGACCRNLVYVIVDGVIVRADRVCPPRSCRRRLLRRCGIAAEADAAELNPEASGVEIRAVLGEKYFIECVGGVGRDGGPAERAGLIGRDPLVDAGSVEGVTAERQQAELIVRLEFGEADGAVAAAAVEVLRGDGAEGEEREGLEDIGGGDAAVEGDDVVCGGGAAEALGDDAEEEVDRGGDDDGGGDDDDDYHNRRRGAGGGWRRRLRCGGGEQRRRRCECSRHNGKL